MNQSEVTEETQVIKKYKYNPRVFYFPQQTATFCRSQHYQLTFFRALQQGLIRHRHPSILVDLWCTFSRNQKVNTSATILSLGQVKKLGPKNHMKSSSSSCRDLLADAICLLDVILSETIKFLQLLSSACLSFSSLSISSLRFCEAVKTDCQLNESERLISLACFGLCLPKLLSAVNMPDLLNVCMIFLLSFHRLNECENTCFAMRIVRQLTNLDST